MLTNNVQLCSLAVVQSKVTASSLLTSLFMRVQSVVACQCLVLTMFVQAIEKCLKTQHL